MNRHKTSQNILTPTVKIYAETRNQHRFHSGERKTRIKTVFSHTLISVLVGVLILFGFGFWYSCNTMSAEQSQEELFKKGMKQFKQAQQNQAEKYKDIEPAPFNWQVDAKQQYSYAFTSTVDLQINEFALQQDKPLLQPMLNNSYEVQISGTLNFRIMNIDKTTGRIKAAFQLEPVEYKVNSNRQPQMEELISSLILVEFAKTGEIVHIHTPHTVAEADEKQLKGLVSSLVIIIPEDGKGSWTQQEKNNNGTYLAKYQAVNTHQIHKAKKRYLEFNTESTPENTQVTLALSDTFASVSTENSWLEQFHLTEVEHRVAPNTMQSEASYEITLTSEGSPGPSANASIWTEDRGFDEIKAAFESLPKKKYSIQEMERLEQQKEQFLANGTSIEDLLNNMVAQEQITTEQKHQVVDFMILFPESAFVVGANMPNIESLDVQSYLINALEMANTEEAQDTLVQMMKNPNQRELNRVQAIMALGLIDSPEPETVQELWEISKDRSDAFHVDLCTTAWLALGTISRTLEFSNPEVSLSIHKELSDKLEQYLDTNNNPAAINILTAIANTRHPKFLPQIEPLIDATVSPADLREAGYVALERMQHVEVTELLKQGLYCETEEYPMVRIMQALKHRETNRELLALVSYRVFTEHSERVRNLMVEYLAEHAYEYPDVKEVLENLAAVESNPGVIQTIYDTLLELEGLKPRIEYREMEE